MKCVKVHLGNSVLNRLRRWGLEEAGGGSEETAFDKAELSGPWTNSSSLGREEKGFRERVHETSSMCSEVMRVASTLLPLCWDCHRPSPSTHVIYLSTSKRQWTLSGHLRMEAGHFGEGPAPFSRLTFITLGYCFCLLCFSPQSLFLGNTPLARWGPWCILPCCCLSEPNERHLISSLADAGWWRRVHSLNHW